MTTFDFTRAPDELSVQCVATIPTGLNATRSIKFFATFQKMDVEEREAFLDRVTGDKMRDADVVREHIVSVSGLKAADGEEFEHSEELLHALLNEPEYLTALRDGWKRVQFGSEAEQIKNF